VAIFNVSLHSLVINQAGKQILRERYGDVIKNLDDRDWYEKNLRTVLNWFANLYASVESLQAFYDAMLEQGVYYVEEMLLVDENEIELFKQADLLERTRFWAAPDTFESLSSEARSHVHGLKLFTDGAIGSRTAALKRPFFTYADKSYELSKPNFGMLIYSDQALLDTVRSCFATRKSLAVHAIGDRAIEQVISALESSGSAIQSASQVRIEHAQLISFEMAKRAKKLGLILCMQPNFSNDSTDYADRLDEEYCRANNPFRMLIDEVGFVAGEDLILGSDGMPHGVRAAAQTSFSPPLESQRLRVDEFVAGYCWEDDSVGSIEIEINQ
jgi:predicted amidohydrolase YtcJ